MQSILLLALVRTLMKCFVISSKEEQDKAVLAVSMYIRPEFFGYALGVQCR